MQPIRTTELELLFAAALSPGWLLLFLPLALAAGWFLYRAQGRALARLHAVGLLVLRGVLLAGLVFLAFRPSLLWRRILTYPGRVVLLLDDSQSMSARDTRLGDAEALRWHRALYDTRGDVAQTCHEIAGRLAEAQERLRLFQRHAQGADRTQDRFWAAAEAESERIQALFTACDEQVRSAAGLHDDERRQLVEAGTEIPGLQEGLKAFFSGTRNPGARTYETYDRRLAQLRARLLGVQAAADARALAAGQPALAAMAERVRGQTRLELLAQSLAGLQPVLPALVPRQGLQCRRLMSGTTQMLADLDPRSLTPVPGVTDLSGQIEALLGEESPFPLTAVVVLSDGCQRAGGTAAATARLAAQKQVPITTVGFGAADEPADVAVLDVLAPPFAVRDVAVPVHVHLKTALPAAADVRVEIRREGAVVAGESVRLGSRGEQQVTLRFVPAALGPARYTVHVAPSAAEIFPSQNNAADFVVDVRAEKVRVLLLDGKPRWETRFALNILQRLDYIDLNSIIVSVQEGGRLLRGSRAGAWPQDRESLAMYDLLVLGELPPDLLTADEWLAVQAFVREQGRTLCLLGSGGPDVLPGGGDLRESLLPVLPRSAAVPAAAPADPLGRICVTHTGGVHPVTRRLGAALPAAGEEGVPRLRTDTQPLLLAAPGGEPLISVRYAGQGKVLLLDSDRLWQRLNPGLLEDHAAIYLNLVTWAVAGDRRVAGEGGEPALLLERHTLSDRDALQVLVPGGRTNAFVEAVAEDGVVATAEVTRDRPEALLSRAVFANLPARDVRFRLRDRPETATRPVRVVEDNPELGFLARDTAFLTTLADASGGRPASVDEVRGCFAGILPKERVEKQERLWRLWDMGLVLAFLVVMLTVEWVWRKLVGLV